MYSNNIANYVCTGSYFTNLSRAAYHANTDDTQQISKEHANAQNKNFSH
jgi:hypothetical protein